MARVKFGTRKDGRRYPKVHDTLTGLSESEELRGAICARQGCAHYVGYHYGKNHSCVVGSDSHCPGFVYGTHYVEERKVGE